MADYRVYWAPTTNPGNLQGELPLTTFSYSESLNAPGAINGAFPLEPYPTLAADLLTQDTFGEARTVLWVVRDGVPMWTGILWAWDASVDADLVTFAGEGWLSWLRRRRIDLTQTWASTDQHTIAAALVTAAAGPIEVPVTTHGVTRDRTYWWWEGKMIGEALEQLAAVENGFDFRFYPVDTISGYEVHFEATHPATGRPTDHVFELGVNCSLMNYASDGKQLTNHVRAFGSGQGSQVALADASDSTALASYLRLDGNENHPDVIQDATLIEHANRALLRRSTPARLLELEVWPDTQPTVGAFAVGDHCTVTARRGFLQLARVAHRITARTIDVDDTGTETVRVTLAPLAMFL